MKRKKQQGSALVMILGIVTIVSIVCGMLGESATRQMRLAQITCDMLRARMIAESGLNKAYCKVSKDFSQINSYRLAESFDGGTFTVTSTSLTNAGANRAQLVSEGVCGLGRAVVTADLENRPLFAGNTNSATYYSLAYDLLAGGILSIGGNLYAGVTKIHSNGNADLGGSADLGSGPVTISSSGTVSSKKVPGTWTLLSHQAAQEIYPEALAAAINVLKDYAAKNGAVYASAADIPASPPGGVAYCTGSDSGWSGSGSGCFIFEGTFSSKHVTITSEDGYPALIVLSPSSVQFNAGTEIYGALILPTSSLKLNGHATISGALLVGQSITGNGTADLYAGDGQGFALPPQTTLSDNVVITAWH